MLVYVAYVKESFGKETRHGVMFPCQESSRDAPTRGSPQFLARVLYSIERFSNDCRKTKTKAITSTSHNRYKQRDEPIIIPSNHL